MNIPSTFELILLLIGMNGDQFSGKTNLHKNLYLIGKMLRGVELPCTFRPYFYGPYSNEIAQSLDILSSSRMLQISTNSFGNDDDLTEVKQTNFILTADGKKAVQKIRASYPRFVAEFQGRFDRLRSTGYHQNTRVLSTAAKVKFILQTERRAFTASNVRDKAKELGWQIKDEDIKSAVNVLTMTGLARVD